MGAKKSTPILPPEYQQVEYIKSSGTQYIDTGVKYYKHTIYLDAQFYNAKRLVGAAVSGQVSNKMFDIAYNSSYGIVVAANNKANSSWSSGKSYGYNRFMLLSNDSDGNLVFNGTTYTPGYTLDSNQQITIPLYLFAQNWSGSASDFSTSSIYRCTIWNKTNGEMIRDYIPCYRKADDVIGLYDIVNDQFKTNAGTGTFTKGANV